MICRAKTVGLAADPVHKPSHVWMRSQKLKGIELPFQILFGKQSVNVVVAGTTKPRNPLFHVSAVEVAFVPLVRVTRARDEMMPRQCADFPTAKFTSAALSHGTNIIMAGR